jgi:RNA-directed DNA polymerase
MIDYYETKTHPITKRMVLDAYKHVRDNGGSAGIDGISISDYADIYQQISTNYGTE